ncbi:MAG: TfoX/Sxy family protein [Hyphomicrobiaceae bacterium]|nr:TfoX/Sxy family protein [Hyphomicrobiaceae bacterium]
MTASDAMIESLIEVLAGLGPVKGRRMFGGAGLFADGVMFALIADEVLYLKVDAANRGDFEAERLGPFTYQSKGRPVELSYWRAPDRVLDDPDEMIKWAARALDVARKAARAKTGAPIRR